MGELEVSRDAFAREVGAGRASVYDLHRERALPALVSASS